MPHNPPSLREHTDFASRLIETLGQPSLDRIQLSTWGNKNIMWILKISKDTQKTSTKTGCVHFAFFFDFSVVNKPLR